MSNNGKFPPSSNSSYANGSDAQLRRPTAIRPSPLRQNRPSEINLAQVSQNIVSKYTANQYGVLQPNQTVCDTLMKEIYNGKLGSNIQNIMIDTYFKNTLLAPLNTRIPSRIEERHNKLKSKLKTYLQSIISFANLVDAYQKQPSIVDISLETKKSLMFHAFGCDYPFMGQFGPLKIITNSDTYIQEALSRDNAIQKPIEFGFDYQANQIINFLQNNEQTRIPQNATIVDMFCGEGSFTRNILKNHGNIEFLQVYGVDGDVGKTNLAQERCPNGVFQQVMIGDTKPDSLPQADYMFSAAPPTDPNIVPLLKAIDEYTTPDAKIILGLRYNEQSPQEVIDSLKELEPNHEYEIIKPENEGLLGEAFTSIIVINKKPAPSNIS